MLKLWTIQLGHWRLAKEKGIYLLDTTAKSGCKEFAPRMEQVMVYKLGELSENDYTSIYNQRMGKSQLLFPDAWRYLKSPLNAIDVLDKEGENEIAIACYCKQGVFCHRHLLKEVMKDYYETQGISVELMGELTKGKK